MLELLREHVSSTHGTEVSRQEIRCLDDPERQDQKAVWNPATAWRGASFGCLLCAPGTLVPPTSPAPYGDARRLTYLEGEPELRRQTVGLTPSEAAEYLERYDRGELHPIQANDRRRELAAARRLDRKRRPRPIEAPLRRIMRKRVEAGEKITAVIDDLVQCSREEPIQFACLVGREVGIVGADEPATEEAARQVEQFMLQPEGNPLKISRSGLFVYWGHEKAAGPIRR